MEENVFRSPPPGPGIRLFLLGLLVCAASWGAEIRFVDSAVRISETDSLLAVGLELVAPECSGEVRIREAVVSLSSAPGGSSPATPGSDFNLLDEIVPIGVAGMAPIRFGRLLHSLVLDDAVYDGDSPETFLLELTLKAATQVDCLADGTSTRLMAGPPLVVTIVDDETPSQLVFSTSRDTVAESQGSRRYSVLRRGGAGGDVTATISTSSRRVAVNPSTLTWADGDASARDFTVTFADDDIVQGDERVRLVLDAVGAVTGQPDRLVITIVDDDERSTVAFNRGQARIGESQQEATFALRRVGRGGIARAALTTSSAGIELDPPVLRWGADETGDRRFTVRFMDDNRVADDRTVVVGFDLSGDAEKDMPDQLALTIVDDDAASALVVTGGDGQTTTVGVDLPAPLVVRVDNRAGVGVEGVDVAWSVIAGDATLAGGASTPTDSQGQASNRVLIGLTAGIVRVRAVVTGTGLAVDFTAEVLEDDPVLEGLLRACRSDEDLNGVCGYFFGLSGSDQRAVIEEIRPEEVASQVNVTQDAPRVQLGNVGARLAALRHSGTRSGIDLLALNVRGLSINPYAMATALGRRAAPELDPVAAVDLALAKAVGATVADASLQDAASTTTSDSIVEQGRLGFYVNGSASFGDRPGTSLETGFDFETLGLTAGVDYRLKSDLFLGVALGYLDTDTDLDADGGTIKTDGLSLSLYLMRYWEKGFYLQGVVGYGENDHDQVRHIDLPVPFGDTGKRRFAARGMTDGTQTSFALEAGYDTNREAWTFGGFGRLSYVETDVDRFSETGDPDGSGFYLEVFDQSTQSLLSEAGLNVSYAASFSWGVLLPQGRLSYLHEFEDEAREIRARFIEDPDTSNVFAIPTEAPDRDYFNVGVGFGAQFQRGVSAFLFYDTDVDRADLDASTFSAGVRFEF